MGLLNFFTKEINVFRCARCKKEIPQSECEWIGNHRFCRVCAARQKVNRKGTLSPGDIKDAPEFRFAESPDLGGIFIGLVQQGEYTNRLFFKLVNVTSSDGRTVSTAKLLPENVRSCDDVKFFLHCRKIRITNTVDEEMYYANIKKLYGEPLFESLYPCDKKIRQQLAQIDSLTDTILAEKSLVLSADSIAKIKKEATVFVTKYNAHPDHSHTFYWSEYPMGATHSKELRKIDSVWTIHQYDHDKTPSSQYTPYPDMNDDNILESFIRILLHENKYK